MTIRAVTLGNSDAPTVLPARHIVGGDPSGGELTEFEFWLIESLQFDGRVAFAELARESGVTEKTVRRKVARLLEEDFIRIVAVTDPVLLGYGSMALVCIRMDSSGTTSAQLADALAALPEVDYVTTTTGRFAVQAELVVADNTRMQEVIDTRIRHLNGVRDVEILAYLRLQYQQARFSGVVLGGGDAGVRAFALDETDRRIIGQLCVDGRAPCSEIARELDVSETTVRQRLQRMTRQGAVKVMAIANPLRLGFKAAGWVAIGLQPGANLTQTAEALTALPAVTYIAITAGRYDLLVEVVCADVESLLSTVNEHIRATPGIDTSEIWIYLDLRYKPLFPLHG